MATRIETDAFGDIEVLVLKEYRASKPVLMMVNKQVPADKYWGAQTQR